MPNRFLRRPHRRLSLPWNEKDYAARERISLRGPMTSLLGANGLIDNGLVEQALGVRPSQYRVTASLEDGARRVEKLAIARGDTRDSRHALIHRDYLLIEHGY